MVRAISSPVGASGSALLRIRAPAWRRRPPRGRRGWPPRWGAALRARGAPAVRQQHGGTTVQRALDEDPLAGPQGAPGLGLGGPQDGHRTSAVEQELFRRNHVRPAALPRCVVAGARQHRRLGLRHWPGERRGHVRARDAAPCRRHRPPCSRSSPWRQLPGPAARGGGHHRRCSRCSPRAGPHPTRTPLGPVRRPNGPTCGSGAARDGSGTVTLPARAAASWVGCAGSAALVWPTSVPTRLVEGQGSPTRQRPSREG